MADQNENRARAQRDYHRERSAEQRKALKMQPQLLERIVDLEEQVATLKAENIKLRADMDELKAQMRNHRHRVSDGFTEVPEGEFR